MNKTNQNGITFRWKMIALASACAFLASVASADLTLTVDEGIDDGSDIILTLSGSVDVTDLGIGSSSPMWGEGGYITERGILTLARGHRYYQEKMIIRSGIIIPSGDVVSTSQDISYMLSLVDTYYMIDAAYESGTDVVFWTMTFDRDEWDAKVIMTEVISTFGNSNSQTLTTTVIPEPTTLSLIALLGISVICGRRMLLV